MGEAAAAKQAEQVELALGAHLVERLVVGEIDDLNDQALAEAPKRGRQLRERRLGERVDVFRASERAGRQGRFRVSAVMAPAGGRARRARRTISLRAASSPSTS